MIGQGVFLKGRVMACQTGSASLELVAWGLAGALACCGALAFAELATMFPESGGVYVYVRRAFGRPAAFTLGWAQLIIAGPAAIGALASGSAIFFDRVSGGVLATIPGGAQWFAVATIVAVTALNCAPVRVNGNIAIGSAILKIVTLAIVAVAGLAIARVLHPAAVAPHLSLLPCSDVAASLRGGIAGSAAALLSALYAYNGWVVVTSIAGEVKNPSRTIPRALGLGTTLVIALYLMGNGAFARVLGFDTIEHLVPTASIGITATEALFGSAWGLISSGILFASTLATLHVVVLNYSRVTYAVARDGLFFSQLAKVSKSGVPVPAVVATSAVAIVLVLVAGFERLSDLYTFEVWLIFVTVVVGLFVLRRTQPDTPRPYRVTGYPVVPAAFLGIAGYVLVVSAVTRPMDAGVAIAITAVGLPVYAIVIRNHPSSP